MNQWLEEFNGELLELGDSTISIERNAYRRSDGTDFEGIFVASRNKPCAAEIEVWNGPGGWELTLSDGIQLELSAGAKSKSEVEALVWLTIVAGAAVVASNRKAFYVPGANCEPMIDQIKKRHLQVRKEWCAWDVDETFAAEKFRTYGPGRTWRRVDRTILARYR